jgi:hypothetical protein
MVGLLVALVVTVSGAREAKAELGLSGGIVQIGGGGHNTDPEYLYQFNINLNGTINQNWSIPSGSSFTVDNLVGIPSNFTTYSNNLYANTTWLASTSAGSVAGTVDVTWQYIGPTISSSSNLYLGTVGIYTEDYATPSLNLLPNSVSYSYSLNAGADTGGGIVALQAPEPSTLIAPLMVLAGLPIAMLLKRRKSGRQQTAVSS